ncbi:putative proline-serine-threonine phosphatase-interacting protein [Aspergillus campestris IBT 28561]|uniref:Proline-serine-threonine phosphatase-interacting protein n=1 Tax=Aspergillus campestris (strain IBT 28561) TaxID=1392248 RepID=A0A2I1DE85_ASPC2|nr:putative proline-serine-threonine phosphatase-interacting protein [Aspergillus campestris IBT 28561]PKY08193.1 putative proline-serine-threonine phosphatase-interacting protein [Aspergillus campestris IBT 28561]
MPGTVAEGPTVSMSFANNFWGKDDAGYLPMLERMHCAKSSCDELKTFYNIRAAIEDEYARKLMALCRKSLGANETGSLRSSFDTVRGETEGIAKAHAAIAGQMRRELEEPLVAFAGGSKERRKIIQNGIERLHKNKVQQTQVVNKTRDRFEQDCLRIKGYLAQGHMVMGHEERKNKAKLEKTQIQLASSSNEYEAAVKILEETTTRWNKEWKAACDKFQDLEEERIDFTKSSLWTYANIASTVCVSDDASCEKIRLSLENCEVEKDIMYFIKERGTGQDIPDPPRFINFCRGDVNDTSSEASEEDGYSVAQFQRTINPAFRSSSPQPSTYESHHDPQPDPAVVNNPESPKNTLDREPTAMQQPPGQPPAIQQAPMQQPAMQQPTVQQPTMQQPARQQPIMQQPVRQHPARTEPTVQQSAMQQPAPLDLRRGGHPPPNYDPNQHGEISAVPHNAYPTDGMTMFCRTGPPSERSSGTNSAYRPTSRDSQSEVSNPTSVSSQEPTSARQSPTKPTNSAALRGSAQDTQVQKKRSTFFSNSPFRRKSRHDKDRNSGSSSRNTWDSSSKQTSPIKAPQPKQAQRPISIAPNNRLSGSPEPVDPRANFQLNVGNNVFDVASPDGSSPKKVSQAKDGKGDDLDPIARALADLKGGGKQSASRVSADRYHGIASPAPPGPGSNYGNTASSSNNATTNANASIATPPPAYNEPPVKRLGAPQPAFTSAQMHKTTQKYTGQTQNMFRGTGNSPSMASRTSVHSQEAPRAKSPAPRRSASPQVAPRVDTRMSQHSRGPSRGPSPSPSHYQSSSVKSRYSQHSPTVSTPPQRPNDAPYSPRYSNRPSSSAMPRAVSPQPQFRQQTRPSSSGGMELQLSGPADPYASGYDSYSSPRDGRPASYYGDSGSQRSQSKSRSMAVADPGQQFSRDGRPILHFARALYNYTAAIPEELGFTKGEVLSVIRLQDDGWWEAEITTARSRPGLVPSNYLQII